MSVVKYVAGNDELTLVKLRRIAQSIASEEVGRLGNSKVDVLAAAAFIEALYRVKHIIFLTEEGLCKLMSSDMLLFNPFFSELKELVIQ